MRTYEGYIGVFDSGVGGISVLKELVRELPHERFVFYGDSANAPYGDKTTEEITALSRCISATLLAEGCKALVIACNTATSAAAATLRNAWPALPIIGIEPALKPAARAFVHGTILVMATDATLRLEKFQDLSRHWGSSSTVIALSCSGLAELIETGDLDSDAIRAYLHEKLSPYRGNIDAVVLGCTHYPFITRQIRAVLGDVPFFDGAAGTARQLRRKLEEAHALAPETQEGACAFETSSLNENECALYERLFAQPLA